MKSQAKFDVRIFLGDKEIKPTEIHKLIISNKPIDRIVNSIVDKQATEETA